MTNRAFDMPDHQGTGVSYVLRDPFPMSWAHTLPWAPRRHRGGLEIGGSEAPHPPWRGRPLKFESRCRNRDLEPWSDAHWWRWGTPCRPASGTRPSLAGTSGEVRVRQP